MKISTYDNKCIDPYVAYNKNGFKITLNPSKDSNNPNLIDILVTFLNVGVGSTVQNLLFQAAVPKVCCFLFIYLF